MINKRGVEQLSKRPQLHAQWLDEDTLIEIMPEAVVSIGADRAELRETTITFVGNESTDDI